MLKGEELGKAIEEAIRLKGVRKAEVARHFRVQGPSLQGWIKTGRIDKGKLPELWAYFSDVVGPEHWGLSPSQWASGGVPQPSDLSLSPNTAIPVSPAKFDANVFVIEANQRPIPVISAIQAGRFKEISDPYPPGAGFDVIYADADLSRWAFALEIEGESMLPEFRPGDRVIIDPEMAPRPGDFVAARNGREEATFKKYRPRGRNDRGDEVFELVPLNEDYPTLRSDVDTLQIIGVMVEHRKRYRRK